MLKTPKTPANALLSASTSPGSYKDNSLDAVVPTPPQSETKWTASPDATGQRSVTETSASLILETPSKTQKPLTASRKRSNNIVFVQTPSSVSSGSSSASNNANTAYTGTYKFEMVTPVRKPNGSGFAFISHSPTTFPLLQPEIDDLQLARRKRRRTSPTELQILEDAFNHCMKPSRANRESIARRVGMNEKAVQIWFQNRRQAFRKQEIINGISPSALAPQKKPEVSSKGLDFDMQNLSPAVELIMRKHIAIAPKAKMLNALSPDFSKDEIMEDCGAEELAASDSAAPTATISAELKSKSANASKLCSPVPTGSKQVSPAPGEPKRASSAPATDLSKSLLFDSSAPKQQTLPTTMEMKYAITALAEQTESTKISVLEEPKPAADLDQINNIFPTPKSAFQSHSAGRIVGSITNANGASHMRAQKFLTEGVGRYRTFGHKFGMAKSFSGLAGHKQYKSESLVSSQSSSSDDGGSSSDGSKTSQPLACTGPGNRDELDHRAFKLPSLDIAFKAKSAGFTIYSDNTDDTDGEESSLAANDVKHYSSNKRQLVGQSEKRKPPVSASVQKPSFLSQPSLARLSMLSNGQAQIVFEGNTLVKSSPSDNASSAKPTVAATTASTLYSLTDDDMTLKAPTKSRHLESDAHASSLASAGVKTPVSTTKDAAKSAASLLRSRLSKSISKAQQFLASTENTSGIASHHDKTRAGAATSSTPPGSPSKRKRLLVAAAKRSPLSPRKLGLLPQPKAAPNYGAIPKFNAGSSIKGKPVFCEHHIDSKNAGNRSGVSSVKPVHRVTKDSNHHNSIRVASFSALPKSRSFTSALLMRHQAPSLLRLAPATATGKSLAAAKRQHSAAACGSADGVSGYSRYAQRLHSDAAVAYQSLSSSSESSPPPKTLVNNQRFQLALAERKNTAIHMSSSSSSSSGNSSSTSGTSSSGSSGDDDDNGLREFKKKKLQRQHHKHHRHQQQQPQVDNTREAECINNLLSLRSGDWA